MNQSRLEEHYFISYSRKNQDIARQLKTDLETNGFKIWMDENDLVPGIKGGDAIRENIRTSIAVLCLVSPASRSSRSVLNEIEYAKIYKKNIIPLWIQGDVKWTEVVSFSLFNTQYLDLRRDHYESGVHELARTLKNLSDADARFMRYIEEDNHDSFLQETEGTRNQSDTNQLPDEEREMSEDAHQVRNPYKGLRAFEYDDAEFFFGREKLIRDMVQQVKGLLSEERKYSQLPRCMMVVGASGSGKSSVVMAGLLPALEDKKNISQVKRWFFLEPVKPGNDPMDALSRTLKLPFLNEKQAGFSPLTRCSQAELRKTLDDPDCHGLTELLRKITHDPDERIVLIVDQFEEIFAPNVHSDERIQFIHLLMAAVTEPDTPLLLLFTLRADFYDRVLDDETLYKMVKRCRIDIPPMTREELRAVIEKPVQHQDINVTFDRYLAEDLLYEVYKRPESLPLLQFTLEQLFERRDREEGRLTRQSYDAIGGLQGAIDRHAEATYSKLRTREHQAEAKKLFTEYFIYITESRDEPSRLEAGEGLTRRRVTRSELQLHDSQSSIRSETIDAFVQSRLLTATGIVRQSADIDNFTDITYEISHEALINAWRRIREWIKESRKDIYLIQSLRPQIKQWDEEENQKAKRKLLAEKLALRQLQDYRLRKSLDPFVEKFFMASLAQQRRRMIRGYLSTSISALVILLLVLGIVFRNVILPPPPDPTIVTSLADSGPGTLSDVIQKASNGATITFAPNLEGKTIYLAHNGLDINESLTIRGPAHGINITSGSTGNYIKIESGQNVTIENMTFINSYTLKHSMIENAGNLTINNSYMTDDRSYGYGGVIYNTGNLTLNDDILEKNTVTTNGGTIYNLFGTININNKSVISNNEAYGNGGGIYSQGGVVTVGGSRISNNNADGNAGGGIDMVNGSLSMHDTQVESNKASGGSNNGYGGGIAIVGSVAFINSSVITENTADAGGGIAVINNTDNNSSSLVELQDITPTNNPNAIYSIGQNIGGDIAGHVTPVGTNLQISDDTSIDNLGSPPPPSPPQELPNYLGVANINSFCLSKEASYGKISNHIDPNATDIFFTCFNHANKAVADFPGQTICQSQYPPNPGDSVTDRMANYYDPTSLQCYKNLQPLGSIEQDGFANYCTSQPQYTGLFNNSQYPRTAYDWLCQPKDTSKLPSGLSVAAACNLEYNANNLQYDPQKVIDRLANFNTPNGWQCWLAM